MRVLLKTPAEPPDAAGGDRSIDFHRRLPGYAETPLVEAPQLARKLGVAKVFVKNETSRFGLPSFKVLGASWATYAALRDRLGPIADGPLSEDRLKQWAAQARPLTLLAATDGNHGRAVARVAKWLGLSARIYIPDFVSPARRRAITAEGAELVVANGVYDASVDAAIEGSKEPNTLLITDTARATTDALPKLIVAGYDTAYLEADAQLKRLGDDRIDVVAVQAAVGGMAAAATHWARVTRKGRSPRVLVVEPENAACVFAAVAAAEPVTVSASKPTEMAVLQCGTLSLTAFEGLYAGVSACIAIEDTWAHQATTELRAAGVPTGLSGAAGAAGLLAAISGPLSGPVRQHMGLTADSRVLVIATESAAASEDP
jgi:diaminopropionate ammonia-lyase